MSQTLVLDATTKSITLVLAGAKTSVDCDIVATWADNTGSVFTEGGTDLVSNGTTPVTVVASPAASTRRIVKTITVYNSDTGAVTASVRYVSSGGTRIIAKTTLAVGEKWTLEGTFDASGQLKVVTALPVSAAVASDLNTGTATDKYVTPDALAGANIGIRYAQIICFDFTTDVATGDGKGYFYVPPALNGMNLVSVNAKVITAGTTGTMDIQIANVTDTTDMLSTKMTIDSTETSTDTAATPAVIDTTKDDVATGDILRVDVDAVQTTKAKGLIVTLGFALP